MTRRRSRKWWTSTKTWRAVEGALAGAAAIATVVGTFVVLAGNGSDVVPTPSPTALETETATVVPSTAELMRATVALEPDWALDLDHGEVCNPRGPLVPVRCTIWGDLTVEFDVFEGWTLYSGFYEEAPARFWKGSEVEPGVQDCAEAMARENLTNALTADALRGGIYVCIATSDDKLARFSLVSADRCPSSEAEEWLCIEYVTWARPAPDRAG